MPRLREGRGGAGLHAGRVRGSMQWLLPNQSPPEIRTAVDGDCETLAELRRRLQQVLEQESPALWQMTDARRAALPEFYAQCIQDVDVQVLVAHVQESGAQRIVATAVGRIEVGRDVARFGSIEDVWVEPEYRGQGVCRALLSELTAFFEARGVEKLSVGFTYGGTAAALWQRLGFSPSVIIANSTVATVKARSR
jgi:ribosomal protein S18 acetylase RimI-like enzyme